MYANVLFSLPENTKLALKEPVLGFFKQTRSLKRTISVMHEPGGPGTERLAANIIGFHLGTPIKLMRSVLGARFIQGTVNDPDRMSKCSFYLDVVAEVKKSTDNYLKTQDLLREHKSTFRNHIARSNLCEEVFLPTESVLPTSYSAWVSDPTPVDNQQRLDQISELSRRYSQPSILGDAAVTRQGEQYVDWMANAPPRFNLEDQLEAYSAGIGVDVRSPNYYQRTATRNERSTRGEVTGVADLLLASMQRDGFARQLLQRTSPGAARVLSVGEQLHNDMYDALVQGMFPGGGDYDGDVLTLGSLTIPRADTRNHLPQNQRNRGPRPRNQRW